MVDSANAKSEGKSRKRNRTAYADLTASDGDDGDGDSVDQITPPPGDTESGKDSSVIKKKKKKKKKKEGKVRRETPRAVPATGANQIKVGKKKDPILTATVDAAVEKELAKQATTAPDIPKETMKLIVVPIPVLLGSY